MLRLSNYTIFADLPDGDVLLVHGYSGAWDIVAAGLAGQLRRFPRNPDSDPLAVRRSADDSSRGPRGTGYPRLPAPMRAFMLKRGYLTRLTAEQERARVAQLAAHLRDMASCEPPSYVFTVSYECNLRCAYCFQDSLRSKPEYASPFGVMSTEMVDRIFSAMPGIESRHAPPDNLGEGNATRQITLFGGEPLLARFRPVVEHIVNRARAAGRFSIAAVTNGTELNHYSDLIGPEKISFLQITLDGAPGDHDRRRIGADGLPTFETIARNIDLALGLGGRVKARVNVSPENLSSLPELADRMNARGWFASENFSAYAIPVHRSAGNSCDECEFGSWELTQRLEELAGEHPLVARIDGPDAPWQRRVREVLQGTRDPVMSLQPSHCGAHTLTWVFDANGDIYACWERAGYGKDRIGTLTEDGTLKMETTAEKTWRSRTIASNPVCGRCSYALYCGGGCALLAELQNGKLHSNYCDGFSRRFKALAVKEARTMQMNAVARAAGAR